MKSKWLKFSKLALLLVCFGFFMPVSCDMNGVDLAKMLYHMDSIDYSILIWVVFISASLSIILSLFYIEKMEEEPLVIDWVLLAGTVLGGLFSLGRLSREYFNLQVGAYVIIIGWIMSFIFLIKASTSKKEQQE